MSVEIEISTEKATGEVEKLGQSILDIATKAKTAGASAKKSLNFGSDALKQLREINKTFDTLQKTMQGFGGVAKNAQSNIQGVANAQANLRKTAAQSSSAVVAQAQAMNANAKASQTAAAAQAAAARANLASAAASRTATGAFSAQNIAAARSLVGLKNVTNGFGLANQAGAGFRAMLQGTGQSFGIFSGSTIAVATGVYAVSKALKESLAVGIEFQYEFNKATAVIGGFATQAGGAAPTMDAFKERIIQLSQTSKYSASEVAQAAKALGQAGQDAAQAMATLPAVLNLATVGEISTEVAANKLVNTLAAFGLAAGDATDVADKMTKAALESTTTIGELAIGLGQVGATAHAAGIGLEVTLGSLALLRQVGISASKAGTDLRNIIQGISGPTTKAQQAFKALGVDTKDFYTGEGGALDLIKAFTTLQDKMKGLSKQQKIDFSKDLFNARSAGAFLDFLDKLGDEKSGLRKYVSDIQNAQGESKRLADIINNNAGTAFAQLRHSLEAIAIQAFTTYSAELTAKIKELTAYIQAHGPEIAQTVASIMTGVIRVAETLVRYGPEILKLIATIMGIKIATALVREAAVGFLLLQGAIKGVGVAALVTRTQVAAAGAAGVAATTAVAGGAAAATTGFAGLLATISRAAPLILAVGAASYYLTSAIDEMIQRHKEQNHVAIDLNNQYGSLILKQKELAIMPTDQVTEYLDRLKVATANAATDVAKLAGELQALKDLQAEMKGGTFAFGTTSEQIDKERQLGVALSLQTHLAEANAAAFVTLQGQSDALTKKLVEVVNALNGVYTAGTNLMNMSKAGKLFDSLNIGIGPVISKLMGFANAAKDSAVASTEAREEARKQGEEETRRSLAIDESKKRTQELVSELKNIISAYGNETGDVTDLNRQLEQNNAIRQMIAGSGGKMSESMRAIGASAELAYAALDWSDQQKSIDAVSTALGNLDPRYRDLAKSIKDAGKGQVDGNTAYEKAEQIVNSLSLKESVRVQVLQLLREGIDAVADGSAAAAAKMATFEQNSAAAWEAFNTSDSVMGKINSFGDAFATASEETKNNVTTSAQMSAVIKQLGTDYSQALDPMQTYNDFVAASNALESQGIQILGGWARARKAAFEQTPLGNLLKENEALALQLEMTAQGGDVWDTYAIALNKVGGDISKLTPELLAAADAQVKLNYEISQMKEVQAAFKSLADGMAHVFADVLTGGVKNFKDFKSEIKSLFKQLLNDLVAMAFKNALFQFFGMGGGGGNTGGFWSSIIQGFGAMMGGSGGGSGGSWLNTATTVYGATQGDPNSGWTVSDLAGQAAANYTGGTYGNNQQGGTSNWLGFMQQGNSAYNQFGGLGGFWNGSGQTMPYSQYFGSSVYGPGMGTSYAPTALGYGTAIAGGLYAGYNRYQNGYGGGWSAAGGAAYGIGTTALALGAGSVMAGSGFAAGVGSMAAGGTAMGASAGVAAAIPVIGWIALAAMVIDMVSGGKLFGTKGSVKGGGSSLDVTGQGASVSQWYTTKGQKPLFGGSYYKEHNMDPGQEAQDAAMDFFKAIKDQRDDFAQTFGKDMGDIVGGKFVQAFDKKGNPIQANNVTTINGRDFKGETQEQFAGRLISENMIAVMKEAGVDVTSFTNKFIEDADAYAEAVAGVGAAMQQAHIDIKGNVGMFSGEDALQHTFDILVELNHAGESMADTYTRVLGSFNLMNQTLGPMGASIGKTRDEYVTWSAELVDSLGGLQSATQIMADFNDTFGGFDDAGSYAMDQAESRIKGLLASVGLDVNTTVEEFAAAFKAILPKMTSAEAADWLRVAEAFSALKKMKDALGDFMFGIEGALAEFEGRKYTHQLDEVNRQMKANIAQARALGASEAQLNQIRKLAAYQIAQIIGQLKSEISSIIKQLHGQSDASIQNQQQEAHDAQMEHINDEREAEREKYEAAQSAIKSIKELLDSLQTSDLSPDSLGTRVTSAQSQFEQTLQAALGGDPEAMQNLAGAAQEYLQLAQEYFGSDVNYADIFQHVTDALAAAQLAFEQIPEPPANSSGGSGGGGGGTQTVQLTEGERYQLALQLAQDIGQLGIATGANIMDLLKAFGYSITELADDLGVTIGSFSDESIANLKIMASALGITVPELLLDLGGNLAELAVYYGVKADEIIAGNYDALLKMTEDLGISTLEALQMIGMPITDLLTNMGVDIATLTTDTPAQLAAVAAALGIPILDLMGAAGITMTDLVAAWNAGLNVASLDPATMNELGSLSKILGIDIVALLTSMGKSVADIGTALAAAITAGIEGIPDLPDDIKAQLQPFLEAIATSGSNEELNTNTSNLATYVNSLPEDLKAQLSPILTALGITLSGDGDATLTTLNSSIHSQTEVMDTVADNTGERGPIVRVLNDIRDIFANAAGAQAAGAQMDIGGMLEEASNAMSSAFFDESIDWSDVNGTERADTSKYTRESENARSNQTTSETAVQTAQAARQQTEDMAALLSAMRGMHKMLDEQTAKIAELQGKQVVEAERTRREQRLNKNG